MQKTNLEYLKEKDDNIEQFKNQNDCIICMDNARSVIFFPCLHLICCEQCGIVKQIKNCPGCNKLIETKKIYIT